MKIFCNLLKQRLGKALVLLGFAVVATQSHAWVRVATTNGVYFTDTNWSVPWFTGEMRGSWGTPSQISTSNIGERSVMVNTAGVPFIQLTGYNSYIQLTLPPSEKGLQRVAISPDAKAIYGVSNNNVLYYADISIPYSVTYNNVKWVSILSPVKDVTVSTNYVYAVSTSGSVWAAVKTNMSTGWARVPAGGYLTSISSGKHPSGVDLIWGTGGDGNIWVKGENPSASWSALPGGNDVRTGNWLDVSPDPTSYMVWARDKWNGVFLIDYTNWPNTSSSWQNIRATSVTGYVR